MDERVNSCVNIFLRIPFTTVLMGLKIPRFSDFLAVRKKYRKTMVYIYNNLSTTGSKKGKIYITAKILFIITSKYNGTKILNILLQDI